ncbi:hypothetical protein ACS0TY_015502 [Phlomoides rotata]
MVKNRMATKDNLEKRGIRIALHQKVHINFFQFCGLLGKGAKAKIGATIWIGVYGVWRNEVIFNGLVACEGLHSPTPVDEVRDYGRVSVGCVVVGVILIDNSVTLGTVSKHFNFVLNTLLKLHTILLINPQPVHDDCTDNRWKYLKGCLGALDGTYIPVKVLAIDIPRYRNQKGFVSVNVLAVCDRNMSYIYVLSGWEGSSVDSRVLCDAVTREHGLKVIIIWLMVGTQTEMVPYRGFKYHLREWDNTHYAPHNYQEPFNIKHSKARNTQNHIILGCCLLHNFIRTHTEVDPMENDVLEFDNEVDGENTPVEDFIDAVEPSQAWTSWRDNLAMQMRVWTYDKENVLVNSLKELVARDYKCDNGF